MNYLNFFFLGNMTNVGWKHGIYVLATKKKIKWRNFQTQA